MLWLSVKRLTCQMTVIHSPVPVHTCIEGWRKELIPLMPWTSSVQLCILANCLSTHCRSIQKVWSFKKEYEKNFELTPLIFRSCSLINISVKNEEIEFKSLARSVKLFYTSVTYSGMLSTVRHLYDVHSRPRVLLKLGLWWTDLQAGKLKTAPNEE